MTAWWAHHDTIAAAVNQYGTPTEAARNLGGISERRAREIWKEMNPDAPSALSLVTDQTAGASATITDTTATLHSKANPRGTATLDPDELLREHGLDPDEWSYTSSLTAWDALTGDGTVTTLHRLAVSATKRPEAILSFRPPTDWLPSPAREYRKPVGRPALIALFPDPHFPMHEEPLVEASIAWLEEFQPDRIVCLGDEGDNSPFKRHRANLRTDTTVQEALWGTFEGLARWRNAAPDSPFDLIPGNHTTWLQNRLLEMFPKGLEIVRPGETEPVLSMRNLLRLDDLGINYHDTLGEYHDVTLAITDDLVLMHGTKTGKHGGSTKEQDGWEGASVIQGHSHKLTMTAVTKRLADGSEAQRYAIDAGTMSKRDLGYNPARNVNQGWPIITLWEDGRWHVDFALFDPQRGDTTWRDWRYSA